MDVLATNISNEPATVYGWIDFDGDNRFEVEERASAVVDPNTVGGKVSLEFPTPTYVTQGSTSARFRISTDPAAAAPTGYALDGEVEDYSTSITIIDTDYGDAPDAGAEDGPSHLVHPTIYLGSGVDVELAAAPTATANSDIDDGLLDALGDLELLPGQQPTVHVRVTNQTAVDAHLYGWIDYNADGVFDVSSEQSTAVTLTDGAADDQLVIPAGYSGTVELVFPAVPDDAVGKTYARFRLSTDANATAPSGAASPTGPADDGEVEDYVVTILAYDFGDAPDSYHTLAASGGPYHRVVDGLSIGLNVDRELVATESELANADDLIGSDSSDEDGLAGHSSVINVTPGQPPSVDVLVTNPSDTQSAWLYGWIDTDFNGTFDAVNTLGDDEMRSIEVLPGKDAHNGDYVTLSGFPVIDATSGTTFARFRLSYDRAAASTPGGLAPDGEVEDYRVTVENFDFGDAPDTGSGDYQTLKAHNGPMHQIDPAIYLGAGVDGEPDSLQIDELGRQIRSANGDDRSGRDDEDGVVNPARDLKITKGDFVGVELSATNNTGNTGTVYGWIDFDGDGTFEESEKAIPYSVVGDAGTVNLSLDFSNALGLNSSYVGTTYARFRFSTDGAASLPYGFARDGEVEDYVVTISEATTEPLPVVDTSIDRSFKLSSDSHGDLSGLADSGSFGRSIASADLNKDGTIDFVVGSYGDANRGAIQVVFMNADDTVKDVIEINEDSQNVGTVEDSSFGRSIAIADLNGDDALDLIVASPATNTIHFLFIDNYGNSPESPDVVIKSMRNY